MEGLIELRSVTSGLAQRLLREVEFTEGVEVVYSQFAWTGQPWREVLCCLAARGCTYAYTRVGEERVLGFHGYFEVVPGSAECWVAQTRLGAEASRRERFAITRLAMGLHEEVARSWRLHRLSVTSPVNSPYHELMCRLADTAGFEYEGTMRKATATQTDCMVFSRTRFKYQFEEVA